MRRIAVALVLLGITTAAAAAPRDRAQEEALDRAVAEVDPALVATLHEGNDAMDRGDPAAAAKAYATVHGKAPDVASVTRRLGVAEARAGDPEHGIAHCREALAKEDSPENHAAVAATILTKQPALGGDLDEAMVEAQNAARRAPSAVFAQLTLCQVAMEANAVDVLDQCSSKLRVMVPQEPSTHVFSAVVLAARKDYDGAERELEAAHAVGLDDKTYDAMHQRFTMLRPKPNVPLEVITGVLGGWGALLFVLFVLGMILSDATERGEPSRPARAVYRGLVVVASGAFYLSAGIGAVLLVGFLALLVLAFLWMSEASRKIQAAVGVVSAYVGIAAVRAMLGRVPEKDFGTRLDTKKEERKLQKTLDAIAKRLHMPKLDAVYAEPDAAIRVVERGGFLGHLRGKNERALVVGVASLEGLSVRELEALVASELSRFRSRDGAGGDLAIVERTALDDLSDRMEARGVATAGNPAWWYVRAFRAFFVRITEGAVTFQEELADARAAKAYGSAALVSALRHVARREVELESRATASLRGLLEGSASLDDVYAGAPTGDLKEAIDEAFADLAEREQRIAALEEDGYDEDEGAEPAWSLFSNRKELESAMKDRLRTTLREHVGFEIEPDQPSKASTVARA